MITYTEKISCKYDGQVNYLGVSVADFNGNYTFDYETMGGIECTITVEKVMERYIEFRVHSNGTPDSGVCSMDCQYQTTAGNWDLIHINMEFDNSTQTYEEALGNFTFINRNFIPITGDAQIVPVEYHTFNVSMADSNLYNSSAWLKIEKSNPYAIDLRAERFVSSGGGARVATFGVEAYQPFMDDYFPVESISIAQQGAELNPQNESSLVIGGPFYVSSSNQVLTITPQEMNNITEFEVVQNFLWLTPTYNPSAQTITLSIHRNTAEKRIGNFGIIAKGADGKEYSNTIFVIQGAVVVDGSINVEGSDDIPYKGGSVSLGFTTDRINENTFSATTDSAWIRNISVDTSDHTVTFEVTANGSTSQRSGEVTLKANSNGGGIAYATIDVRQVASPTYLEFPLWKDTFIEFQSDVALDYRLELNSEIIYQGRIFPINGKCTLYVNDILSDFVNETLDFEDESIQDNEGYRMFVLQLWDEGLQAFNDVRVLRVWNDWTYDEIVQQPFISDMTDDVMDSRQYFVQSYLNTVSEGRQPQITLSGPRTTSTRPYTYTFTLTDGIQSIAFRAGKLNWLYVSVGDDDPIQTYEIKDTCKPYCLYWLNSRGGYNFHLFNKASKQTDGIESYDYSRFDTSSDTNPKKEQYIKKVTNRWVIKTDYVNDRKSEILAEIAHSPQAWLHILDEDRMVPVNIVDTSVEHRTFMNNGRKPCQYQFTVENKMTKLRK